MAATRKRAASKVSRNDQVVRVLNLLRELERLGGVDIYELAERYGTSERTIRRDLAAIQEAGIPLINVDAEDSQKKRWMVDEGALKSLGRLMDASHYLALRLAMGQAGAVREQSVLFAALEDVASRIETALGTPGRKHLTAIDACFFSWEKFAWTKAAPELLWPLVMAIIEKAICVVTYRGPQDVKPKKFRVLPLRLFVHQGAVYVHYIPQILSDFGVDPTVIASARFGGGELLVWHSLITAGLLVAPAALILAADTLARQFDEPNLLEN